MEQKYNKVMPQWKTFQEAEQAFQLLQKEGNTGRE